MYCKGCETPDFCESIRRCFDKGIYDNFGDTDIEEVSELSPLLNDNEDKDKIPKKEIIDFLKFAIE